MPNPDVTALTLQVTGACDRWWMQASINSVVLPDNPEFRTALAQVWEGSDFVARTLEQQPQLLGLLVEQGRLTHADAPGDLDQHLRAALASVTDEAALYSALRRFRRMQMLRIIWRDLAGWAALEETLEDLSALADACIQQTIAQLHAWQVQALGVPEDEDGRSQQLLVLGMGKLGARELNLSSDIDLIFAFPRHGPVRGSCALTSERFFQRLAQRLVQALNQPTADGFVFRVDTRLRPFGDAGPLAPSLGALEDYYQTQAREWERYAMVKARPIAGDAASIEQLMGILRPFVYRRYLDFAVLESLRDMKRLIVQELMSKGLAENIKLGPGGIREIEFIAQAFQIVRGGRDPELQIRALLPVLNLLGEKGLLPFYAVHELQDAYRWLRRLENRLQAWRDEQTHCLPEDAGIRLRLARAMNFADWDSFAQVLGRLRQRVQGHFDTVFTAPQAETAHAIGPYAQLWRNTLEPSQAITLLAGAGFSDPATALRRLQDCRTSPTFRQLGHRGQTRIEHLLPLLLEAVTATPTPDMTLERILSVLDSIARRTAYLALLVEHPLALSQLVRLVAASPWIARHLARQPLLLDELLDPRRLYAPLRRQDLMSERDALLAAVDPDDQEQQMERLRQFAQSNLLRVAAADLSGVIPLMVVSDYLTDLAEVTLITVLEQAWTQLTLRHGRPPGISTNNATGFAIIGYGKLGGIELGYGSDLDLVFLHDNGDPDAFTDGPRPIANAVFHARLAQRLIHLLNTQTPAGILYAVDTRLRPDGNSGLLVSSLDAFAHYQTTSAWTWEHQALLRARPVAGDLAVSERFLAIRRDVLSRERDPEQLRLAVREMREKMRVQLDRSRAGLFDLKQGAGGIADIEFMVQYAVLRDAAHYPDLLDWTDNVRLLATLAQHELLPDAVANDLADNYRSLRGEYHRMALQSAPGLVPDTHLQPVRQRVRDIWQQLLSAA